MTTRLYHFPRTDEFYGSLPPLIPQGSSEDERDRILQEIAEAWATPLPSFDVVAKYTHGVTLNGVALWDAEREEPVNLGEILRRVRWIVDRSPDFGDPSPRAISLRACRVDQCDADNHDFERRGIHVEFIGVSFGDGVSFRSVTFGDDTQFWASSFGARAVFENAEFGDRVSFSYASLGVGVSFKRARFGQGALFDHACFGDGANFAYSAFDQGPVFRRALFGDDAVLEFAEFGEDADFWFTTFGRRAALRGSKYKARTDFRCSVFGEGADFQDAHLRAMRLIRIEFNNCRLRTAGAKGKLLDLVWPFYSPPFILDDCASRNADLSYRSRDPWSVLRRSYTGVNMVFILFFTLLAFLPVTGKAVFWGGISKLQRHAAPVMLQSVEHTHDTLASSPGDAWDVWTRNAGAAIVELREDSDLSLGDVERVYKLYASSLPARAAFRAAHPSPSRELALKIADMTRWGEQAEQVARVVAPDGHINLEEKRVLALALGTGRGWWNVALASLLIAYNIARAAMTYLIGPMRDHADQVGRSPAWSEYKGLWTAHMVLSVVLLIAVLYGVWRVYETLAMPLLVPGGGA